ncbi:type I polyketide synthase, partial [Janthinobacterium sp.]|uniref:polyketide synthase family protein n=1 Tax=Janthinobacterium sp. TaxID=1871054 RepID=UPI002585C04D
AYAALEDAGYTRETLARYQASGMPGNVGVYVGVMYEEYQLFAAEQQLLGNPVTVSSSPASIVNRVSYFLNLHGPSMAVDTMCSSSLTAIHLACESLQRGGCEMAIAGGVNVSIHPNKYLMLGQGKFASSKGQCESFGLGGDGYVPGEGVGAVLLKPLHRALADGDHIHGIIKASAINHGGKTNGYTVPNPVAQAHVVANALKVAGVEARAISYIEAHGTGTSLGDPIEIAGLSRAFGQSTADRQFCAIGSVKSNIGHGESAAGIAGLTKVLLQMRHGQLAPSLHARQLNPNIDFSQTPFVVQQELAEWVRPVLEIDGVRREYPRLAGLSSFGAGGANAHVIIEEYRAGASVAPVTPGRTGAERPALVLLSAKNAARLRERVAQLLEAVEQGQVTDANLADAAYTLQVGREAMDERLALAAPSVQALRETLLTLLATEQPVDGVYRGVAKKYRQESALPIGGDDLAAVVDGWLAQGQEGKLLELWSKGLLFDWHGVYGATRPRRISLPTYPFARESCWLPQGVAKAAHGVVKLHPLVHTNISDFNGQRYRAQFDGDEFFLADHRIQGRRVLPGAAYLEMACAALRLAQGASGRQEDGRVRLRNIVWPQALAVDGQPVELHIGLYPEDDGMVAFEVYSEGPSGVICHSQGLAEAVETLAVPGIDLAQVRAHCTRSEWTATRLYAKFADSGLHYGPSHRAIESLYVGEQQVLARLVLPAPLAATRGQFALHPSLLDAA